MPRVIHFEIPASQPERIIDFYAKVFGWGFQKWEGPLPYWLITTGTDGPGIDGGLTPRQHPGQSVTNTVGVESLDAAIATVEQHGGTITVPKMAIPGVGWLAYAVDPEGNPFGMMQNDSSAA